LIGVELSCKKQNTPTGVASLTMINAVVGSSPYLVPNFGGDGPITWYSTALKLIYDTATTTNQTGAYSGMQKLAIYRYPDTSAHSTPLFNLTLNLPAGSTHTLFLTGTVTSPDTLFTTDTLPYYPASDSSLGVRFVNLSQGSAPISVNVKGLANGSEVGSLSYKSITGFKKYPATSNVSSYVFEIRDVASGNLIISYTLDKINLAYNNARRFKNFTVALVGTPGDAVSTKAMGIPAYFFY
jgi:hypothetical protein